MTLDRRRLLRLTGAAAVGSTTGLAGCADTLGLGTGTSTGDPPGYADWIAADDGDVFFAYVDWAALDEYDGAEADDPSEETGDDDAILGLVDVGLTASVMSLGLGFATVTGLDGLVAFDEEEEDGLESTLEETVLVGDALVCLGEFDAEEIESELTSTSVMDVSAEFELTGEIGGYDRYETVEGEDDAAVAVDGTAIVYASGGDREPGDAIRRLIDAHAGDAERAAETSDDLEWLLGAADGHVAAGYYGDADEPDEGREESDAADELFSVIEGATGAAGSFTIEGARESSVEFAARYDDGIDGDLESDLESTLGDSAADVEVSVDGDRVTATGTWEGDPVTDDEDG